jgi:hypothetical protein
MAIYAPMIRHHCMMEMGQKVEVTARPFSVLGLDLLIDEKMKSWILEVNDHPSLNIYFDTSKEFFGQREMTDDDVCPLDFYIKSRLTNDMINLAREKDISAIDSYGCLE